MRDRFQPADAERRGANVIMPGVISEVDLAAGTARVEFEDDWISGDLPWFSLRAGALRTWSPPTVGEQCVVLSPDGEPATGMILLGLTSDAFPAPSESETETRSEWEDGAIDSYDTETHVRTLTLPEGGKLLATIGDTVVEASEDKISLKVGSAELLIEDGEITLKADTVNLGDKGGLAVARMNDNVAANKVVASSTKVKAK